MSRAFAEVIGDPIAHSRSPLIHAHWLARAGIAADYRRTRVDRAGLPAFLAERRENEDWRGCNVTMPLKLDALALADEASDRAVAAGAANLLVPREGRLFAGNTDVGAIATLVDGLRRAGKPMAGVTLLGNGGAARAALVALNLLGVGPIRIQARDLAAARKLAVEFGTGMAPEPLTHPIEGSGVINATPLGMEGRDCLNCDLSGVADDGWVMDMVTEPAQTALLRSAQGRGLATIDGLAMLVEQAAASFRLLFGAEPPRDADQPLWETLRG